MRKTIIPAAIVLAAPAVTMQAQEIQMQAQELTKKALNERISVIMTEISKFPQAVKDEYAPKLSGPQNQLNEIDESKYVTDEQKEELETLLSGISATIEGILTKATEAQQSYADERDAALQAIEYAEQALNDAKSAIKVLEVPSIVEKYYDETTDKLKGVSAPTKYTEAQLYESIELSKKAKEEWEAYQTDINTLKKQAEADNSTEMQAQPGRLTELQELIRTYKSLAVDYYNTVSAYLSYSTQDSDKTYFQTTAPDAFDSKGTEIVNSKQNWLLTESEAKSFRNVLEEKKKDLDRAAKTAEENATAQAKANAEALTATLHAKYNESESEYVDKFISDAKTQADNAIQAALDKKAALLGTLDATEHLKMANELYQLVKDVAPFVTAVTEAENNYAAYTALVTLHDNLKKAYDEVAIELSTMQANGEIDSKYYNEANNKLNVVAQNLAKLSKQNETNYDKQAYADYTTGTPDDDYNTAKSLLGDYDEATKIQQILEDAKKANDAFKAKLQEIEVLRNTVTADVTVTPTDTKYKDEADQLTEELTQKKNVVLGQIDTFETAYTASKDFDSDEFDDISKAVKDFNDAVTKAKADLKAYEDSKNKLAGWTIAVEAIEVPNEEVNAAYPDPDKETLNNYIKQVKDIKADITSLEEDTKAAFAGPDRTSQAVWDIISGKDYDTTLPTLKDDLKKAYKKYKEWRDKQGDEDAYNFGKKYYDELSSLFTTAVKNGAYEVDAEGEQAVADEMKKFETELAQHPSSHATNNCIALMDSWAKTYETVKASITRHEEVLAEYKNALPTFTADGIKSADVKKLYENLTNQSAIDAAITTAQGTLKEVYTAKVKATEGTPEYAKVLDQEAKNLQTGILNLIAQASLKETYSEEVTAEIKNVTAKLTSDLNPESYYTDQLDEIQTKYEGIVSALTYESYNDAKKQEVATLIASIDGVLQSAQANYDKYQSQMTAHENAKAKWASFYSSVGATYGDQFPGAQAIYQGQLNGILQQLNEYEAKIKAEYQNGGSVALGDKDYSEIIGRMQDIADNATLNKTDYESQKKALSNLQTEHYDPAIKELDVKISTVEANIAKAVGEADDEQIVLLNEQLESLKAYKDSLEGGKAETSIKKQIEALTALVEAAVNDGKSSENNKDYTDQVTTIRQDIASILGQAKGKYNENAKVHNTVIENLFMQAYNAAKDKYEQYALVINKYGGYTHALEDGKSAYEDCINTTHAAIFDLNTKLIATKDTATTQFAADTKNGIYTDSSQPFAKEVQGYEAELDKAYTDFLAATRIIADGYATPLKELAEEYDKAYQTVSEYYIVTSIEGNTPEETATKRADKLATYFTFDGTQPKKDYDEKGPETLDGLLDQVDTQKADVLTAWNKAAQDEAEAAKDKALASYDSYNNIETYHYPTGYTAWTVALTAAKNAIDQAETDIDTYFKTNELNNKVDGIKTALTTAIRDLSDADTKAATDCGFALEKYDTNLTNINTFKSGIENYKRNDYAAELTGLINAANNAVTAYEKANETAFNALYDLATSNELTPAKKAAVDAYNALVKKAAELEAANQPAVIVNTLLKKAQELRPLYNRAEANAKGNSDAEEKCKEIYSELNTLLTTLRTADEATDEAKKKEIADNKATYEDQIEKLKADIIAADLEQVAYTDLLEMQAKVAQELEAVKTTISGSVFADALNTTFKADLDGIATSLSAAATQINIDHANNRCGKEGAYSLEQLAGISTEISNLSAKVDAEIAKLAKAEADEATRTANKTAYDAATAVISELSNELVAQWCVAQGQNLDVYTLFAEKVTTLHTEIEGLQTSLDAAYEAAQNVNGDPSKLDTSDYTTNSANIQSYYTRIEKLMGEISASQTQFEADVTSLKEKFEAMNTAFDAIVNSISDIAAANEDVQKEQIAIDKAIDEIEAKMQNFGPEDTKDVQDMIDAANTRITAFATLVAGKTYVPGDITGTGSVDINDTFKILDLVLGKLSVDKLDEKAQKAADMDGDGAFTVADLVQITNLYVYGEKTGQQGSNRVAAAADAEVGSIDMQLDTDRMSVLLDSNTGYSAIQMDVEMPQGVSINEVNFAGDSQKVMVATNTLENGVQRIVIYSTDGSSILNGETSLINLGLAGEGMGIVGIDNIIASTAAGQRHNLMGVTGAYTIVTGIEATETAEGNTSVFDINGMVRKTVQKGVNIVKDAAGKVKKMLMK